tara:strand:+ start:169 stop:495 length:327 start_codon:yes stop_codon:yes gene_type:complete
MSGPKTGKKPTVEKAKNLSKLALTESNKQKIKRKILLNHWDQSYKLATRSVKTFDILKARNVKIGVSGWNSKRIAKSIKTGYENTKKSYLNKSVTAIHSLFTGSGKTK